MRKILCIFTCVLLCLVTGCASNKKEESKEETSSKQEVSTPSDSQNTQDSQELQEEQVGFEEPAITEESYAYLIEDTQKNIVSIKMPEDKQYNAMIEEYISKEILNTWGETFDLTRSDADIQDKNREYSDVFLELNATISYASKDLVSVVVEGLFNRKGTAYPTNWLFTINFNPQTTEIVKFADLYAVNPELYEMFANQVIENVSELNGGVWPEMLGDFSDSICSEEKFLRDMESGVMYYYFNENGVVISCSVIHALGDHLEGEIPYDVLVGK